MKSTNMLLQNVSIVLGIALVCVSASAQEKKSEVWIVTSNSTSVQEELAAKEICRYIYQRTGELATIVPNKGADLGRNAVIIATRGTSFYNEICPKEIKAEVNGLKPEGHIVKTVDDGQDKHHYIIGADSIGTLYGAYIFVENMGVQFTLNEDIIPDDKIKLSDIPDSDYRGEPLFNKRGILPFHDFPEGPDIWTLNDYKTYFTQLSKLRMNFFTLHCYPETSSLGPEPTVWNGLPEDVNEDGTVEFSYPAKYASTVNRYSGYRPWPVNKFVGGADRIFETDDFGSEITDGFRPEPTTVTQCNQLFNRAGRFFDEAFSYGNAIGLNYCIGTELPLKLPTALRKHLIGKGLNPDDDAVIKEIYKGTFKRISKTHPLEYYWLWTGEAWQWNNPSKEDEMKVVKNFKLAQEGLDELNNPFQLASAGWVMGPPNNRSLFDDTLKKDAAISCISRYLGSYVVEPGFDKVKDRPKWAIPWLEDDVAMTTPQFWAGRMRRDAADALKYECTGLLGLLWRTKQLAPNVIALANAAWDQKEWNLKLGKKSRVNPDARNVSYGGENRSTKVAIAGDNGSEIYRTAREGARAYNVGMPNGKYIVRLHLCEYSKTAKGQRVFDVHVQGNRKLQDVDIFSKVGKDKVYSVECSEVTISDENIEIEFIPTIGEAIVSGIEIVGTTKGGNQIESVLTTRLINCGGGQVGEYEADLKENKTTTVLCDLPDEYSPEDIYYKWTRAMCGENVAKELSAIFMSLDGGPRNAKWEQMRMPRPSDWIGGPGGFRVDNTPWEKVRKRYAFVDKMKQLQKKVEGKGNIRRFDYWLNTFEYTKTIAEMNCMRGQLDILMNSVKKVEDSSVKLELIREQVLPTRLEIARMWEKMITLMLQHTDTPGEMGTIMNLEQHVRGGEGHHRLTDYVYLHDKKIEAILGEKLSAKYRTGQEYLGKARMFVPTIRTSLNKGEQLTMKVIVLDKTDAKGGTLYWRKMGEGDYNKLPLAHINRAVYNVQFPILENDAIEYYIKAETAEGELLTWPPTAPELNQTIVVMNQ